MLHTITFVFRPAIVDHPLCEHVKKCIRETIWRFRVFTNLSSSEHVFRIIDCEGLHSKQISAIIALISVIIY